MTREQLIHWQKRRKMGELRYSAMTGALGFAPVAFVVCQLLNIGETIAGVMGITFGTTLVGVGLAYSLFGFNERIFQEEISKRGVSAESDFSSLPQEENDRSA